MSRYGATQQMTTTSMTTRRRSTIAEMASKQRRSSAAVSTRRSMTTAAVVRRSSLSSPKTATAAAKQHQQQQDELLFSLEIPVLYRCLLQGMLVATTLCLLKGMNQWASAVSLVALVVFVVKAPRGADPTPAMICAFSVVAAFGCSCLVQNEATFDRFLGHLLGRLVVPVGVGFFVYQDVTKPRSATKASEEEEDLTTMFEIVITILEARNLVPKDGSMLGGFPKTSDPFVKIVHGRKLVGKTKTIKQTLDPKWKGQTYREFVQPSLLALPVELNIFDHDVVGKDDPMGTVYLTLPNDIQGTRRVTSWYPVWLGTGKNFCENATGELLVEFQLIPPKQQEQPQPQSPVTENETRHMHNHHHNDNDNNDDSMGKMSVTIKVKILKGRDMVAKDTNLVGKPTTSDPYVVVNFGKVCLGKTKIVKRTVNPTWENNKNPKNEKIFEITVLKETIDFHRFLELNIFDHDLLSRDDPMGTVYVKIPTDFQQQQPKTDNIISWYPVERGQGQYFCRDAIGSLCVELQVIPHGLSSQDNAGRSSGRCTPEMITMPIENTLKKTSNKTSTPKMMTMPQENTPKKRSNKTSTGKMMAMTISVGNTSKTRSHMTSTPEMMAMPDVNTPKKRANKTQMMAMPNDNTPKKRSNKTSAGGFLTMPVDNTPERRSNI